MPRGEGIKQLSQLFEKYRHTLKAPQASVVKVFCEVVEDVLAIKIDPSDVVYNSSTKLLTIKTSGVIKSEIRLHQKEIFEHLKGRLGVGNAPVNII